MSYDHLNDPLCKKIPNTLYLCSFWWSMNIHSYWLKSGFGICRNNHFRKCWARSNCSSVEGYSCYKAEFPENLTADHQEEQYILLDQRLHKMGKISSNWEVFQLSHIAKVQFTLYQNNWAVWQFLGILKSEVKHEWNNFFISQKSSGKLMLCNSMQWCRWK